MPITRLHPPRAARTPVMFLLTLALYVLVGVGGLALAIPPAYAAPLYPAAGVALVAVLLGGWRMLPAVAMGAAAVNFAHSTSGAPHLTSGPMAVGLPVVLALGAALQAGVGGALVRRWVRQPLTLGEPSDVLLFAAAAAVSCAVGAAVATLALWRAGLLSGGTLFFGATSWWMGDLLGALIAVPIGLTWFGRPREAWAPRTRSVALTLCLVTLVLAVGIRAVTRWHQERTTSAFERDAAAASLLLTTELQDPLQALRAMHGALQTADGVTLEKFEMEARDWLVSSHLLAIGWAAWLRSGEIGAFEADARANGAPGFRVFDRAGSTAPREAQVAAVRFVEPRHGPNLAVLGLNVMSVPPSRAAVQAALRSGAAAATAAFRLVQPAAADPPTLGVVVYRPVTPHSATGAPTGFVFVTIELDEQLQAMRAAIPDYLAICLVDVTGTEPARRLAGPGGCEAASFTGLAHAQKLPYAGRDWEIRVSARPNEAPGAADADVWLFAMVGLASTAILGGFLLVLTGRTRRIETAVHQRTSALQAEVHERERAQKALGESEQRFRNILNNVPIGVTYTDLAGNVKQTNPRFRELVGYSEEELLALNVRDFTHPDDVAQSRELTAQLLLGALPMYREQKRLLSRRGEFVWVQATVTLLRDAAGEPRRVVGVVEDVSENIKLEEAERAREAAEAANRAKSEFLSRMSHELRTPLNAMLGFAQLLELDPRHPLTPTQQPWVAQIQQAGWHLLEMINDVLDLSRIESGNLRLRIETLDLPELIDATQALVQGEADRRGIAIAQTLGSGASGVLGDATRVKQILTNLLSNAVKYNTDGGRLDIVTRQVAEDRVEISVTDSGLGMNPEQLAQLFQPFNRLGREKSSLQGTGIGLVISQRLAELMGGKLGVQSVVDVGSTFVLTLPCETEPDTIRSDFDPMTSVTAEYHRRIVHYVEDNETNVEVMRGILSQRPQVELEVSVTGLDGLAAIRARRPDLILLDMHLPDINGMELLRYVKTDPRLRAIPVVVVSADALAQQIDDAYAAGCARYLTKPVNIGELLRVIDDVLDQMDTRYS